MQQAEPWMGISQGVSQGIIKDRQKWGSQEIFNANKHGTYDSMQKLELDAKEHTSGCF